MMQSNLKLIVGIAVAVGAGFVAGSLLSSHSSTDNVAANSDEKKPLYWVAPMDPNYRRDKPGKSPMGMDLVPVYEEGGSGEDSPGTVRISPTVENNLGVRTQAVVTGILSPQIQATGYVGYNEDALIHVHPRVSGWLNTLSVKSAGQPVEKGQALYTLYSPELVNAQKELVIASKRGEATLIAAAEARLQALNLPDSLIRSLKQNGEVRQQITFYAPQSGIVAELPVREGFYVQPNSNVMSIASLDQVWVEADVFARDASRITVGQSVSMTLPYAPGNTWQGRVDFIYPTLDDDTRTLRVRMRFDNPGNHLKPGMYTSIAIDDPAQQETLLVPNEALIRTQAQTRVVVALGEGQFKSVAVNTGQSDGEVTQVLDGLMQGDSVVVSAQFLLDSESSKSSDFMRMTPASAKTEPVWVKGEVQRVDTPARVATITHDPVPEWDWPEMTMDFNVGDEVDIEALAKAQSLHMELTESDDGVVITGIHVMTQKETSPDTATVDGEIEAIDTQNRVFTIHRGPIEKWGRPPMTMDFVAGDNIDMTQFSAGDNVRFTFEAGGDFTIVEMEKAAPQTMSPDHSGHGEMP